MESWSIHDGDADSGRIFPLDKEYTRSVDGLYRSGVVSLLTNAERLGIIGFDGKEYPIPSMKEVGRLIARNRSLVDQKYLQGFDRLELTPLGISSHVLIERLREAVVKHAAEGTIFKTRKFPSEPQVPVRVNAEKQAWVWETLYAALDTDEMVYFPENYTLEHHGMNKAETITDRHICAVPGWSVGLVENQPILPQPDEGLTLNARRQLEIGLSPREYLEMMSDPSYRGETGMTLEDFITGFLVRLESTGEVSHDVKDNNALWCLAQYMRVSYAELVPTGRWHHEVGRVRLDMHRTGNRQCTKSWGAATMVRLVGG